MDEARRWLAVYKLGRWFSPDSESAGASTTVRNNSSFKQPAYGICNSSLSYDNIVVYLCMHVGKHLYTYMYKCVQRCAYEIVHIFVSVCVGV